MICFDGTYVYPGLKKRFFQNSKFSFPKYFQNLTDSAGHLSIILYLSVLPFLDSKRVENL